LTQGESLTFALDRETTARSSAAKVSVLMFSPSQSRSRYPAKSFAEELPTRIVGAQRGQSGKKHGQRRFQGKTLKCGGGAKFNLTVS